MNDSAIWYEQLAKPFFAPPASLFGPVWTVLYIIIAISFGYIFYLYFKKRIPGAVALPFALNLVFNLIFSPLQFGLRSNILALIDIFLVLGTLIWALSEVVRFSSIFNLKSMLNMVPKIKWVMYVNIPYLLWVSFATILQISITWMNW